MRYERCCFGDRAEPLTRVMMRMRHTFYSPDGRGVRPVEPPKHSPLAAEGGSLQPVTRFPESGLFLEEPTLSRTVRTLRIAASNGGSSLWLMTLERRAAGEAESRRSRPAPGLGPYEIRRRLVQGRDGGGVPGGDTRLDRRWHQGSGDPSLGLPEVRQSFDRSEDDSQLSHPNICALYDVGHQDGRTTSSWVPGGRDLADVRAGHAQAWSRRFAWDRDRRRSGSRARQGSCTGPEAGNVMLTKGGVKLLTSGWRRREMPNQQPGVDVFPDRCRGAADAGGHDPRDFQYMAPEQLEGKGKRRANGHLRLGCVLYEMGHRGRSIFRREQGFPDRARSTATHGDLDDRPMDRRPGARSPAMSGQRSGRSWKSAQDAPRAAMDQRGVLAAHSVPPGLTIYHAAA